MSGISLLLSVTAFFVVAAIVVAKRQNKPRRIMHKGKLLKSEIVCRDGEKLYGDWHVCIHAYYLISDRLTEGHTILEQRWSYEDFCNVTIRHEDCTYALIRQVDVVALVRSFRPIPVDEFDRIAQPLII